MPSADVQSQSEALSQGVGVHVLEGRSLVEIMGRDRARLLHSLCTNDIQGLTLGNGCEAFLTNPQGRTVGYVYVFSDLESLVLDTAPGQAESIVAGLEPYVIREDVQLHDRTSTWGQLLLSGQGAKRCLKRALQAEISLAMMSQFETEFAGQPVWIRRVPYTGPTSYFVTSTADLILALAELFKASGATACGEEAVQAARLEAGSPQFGPDITAENLPQEVNRNEQAISFVKGCYLGQETVARLDALGHVNRVLCGLRFHSDQVPAPGFEIHDHGKVMARITSSAWSYRLKAPLALAYVRHGHEKAGHILHSSCGEAEVVTLPLAS